jgi:hypothetical protein
MSVLAAQTSDEPTELVSIDQGLESGGWSTSRPRAPRRSEPDHRPAPGELASHSTEGRGVASRGRQSEHPAGG